MPVVYLIPTFLSESATETLPAYCAAAMHDCEVIFAENERTARRFMKAVDPSLVIDHFEWHTIHKAESEQKTSFIAAVKAGKNIAILSEAGCPGIADPGQVLIALAQELNCKVKPLVGPNSILLALMASGMNGQQFEFTGYLPIEQTARIKKIKELEAASLKQNSTKIFIETPYRNNELLASLLKECLPETRICIGINLTGKDEQVITKTAKEWKKNIPELHKIPAIFLLYAGNL
jgi:16S rRNA (cytidine1402-2'-O)-methyltransferase